MRLGGNGRENPSRSVVFHIATPPRPTHHRDWGPHSPKHRVPPRKRAQGKTHAIPTRHADVGEQWAGRQLVPVCSPSARRKPLHLRQHQVHRLRLQGQQGRSDVPGAPRGPPQLPIWRIIRYVASELRGRVQVGRGACLWGCGAQRVHNRREQENLLAVSTDVRADAGDGRRTQVASGDHARETVHGGHAPPSQPKCAHHQWRTGR